MSCRKLTAKLLKFSAITGGIYFLSSFSGFHRKEKWKKLLGWDYAHRGLPDEEAGIPENSMRAFRDAVQAGYGIEMDVRVTADNRLVIMHDGNLKRMCGIDRKVSDMTLKQMGELTLAGTDMHIPLFSDVLRMVGGRVPLIVEIKADDYEQYRICPLVWKELKDYPGLFCIESFNPLAVQWFLLHHPRVVRGQLSCDFLAEKIPTGLPMMIVANLMTNFMTLPDFISYKYTDTYIPAYQLNRHVWHAMTALWTVRNLPAYRKYKNKADLIIFEGFRP